jgi:hypothetical protein
MITLIGAGCSFTLGSELADDNDSKSPSNYTWAALLAKKFNMNYHCVAKPGISNQTIARTLFDTIVEKQHQELAVAVMWSFTNRYEIFSNNDWLTVSSQTRNIEPKVNTWYEICGDSEVYEIYTSLTSYLMIQELLERKNIPYMFTSADVCIFNRYFYKHPTTSIRSLQTEINWDKWVWIGKNKEGFFTWGSRYPAGPYLHPLEEAHEELANMLLPSAKKLLRLAD